MASWSSARQAPHDPEALVLNFLDDLDAKMQAVTGEFEKSIREGKSPKS